MANASMANASIVPTPRILSWYTDPKTAQAATAHKLPLPHVLPARQVDGCETNTEIWRDRIIHPPTWTDPIRSDPAEIIKQFKQGRYTQGLALVVSWGGMGRRAKAIYGEATPAAIMHIERTLQICARDIQESLSIDNSWQSLAGCSGGELHWSEVMTSKTLHFLCRSLGFEKNPPVPLDGEVIRGRLWPFFRYSMPLDHRPDNWEGPTFQAYCRYMTAIRTWADKHGWTTTEMEATIWDHFSLP
jgi:hypothetical protein